MRPRSFSLALICLPLVMASACSPNFANPLQALRTSTAAPAFGAPRTPPASSPQSSIPDTALGVSAMNAPICQASSTCAAADAEQIPVACVKKVPYTNVLVPPGTTFVVLDTTGDFVCQDSGVQVNGKEVLTCHGTELFSFQLQLSNPSCSALAVGTSQCDQGYGYDAAHKCCSPLGPGPAGSTVVTVNLGACPLPGP